MGAVFAVPYARMTDWRDGLAQLRGAGFRLLALTPDQAAMPIGAVLPPASPADRIALLLGTEGDGLSARWLARGGPGGLHPDEPHRDGPRRGLAQRGGRGRSRLPRPHRN